MWYLTYYEEYPIYEAAEGGYYYAGVSAAGDAYAYKTLNEALADVPRLAEELMLEPWEVNWASLSYDGHSYVAMGEGKYIGEDRYLVLETTSALYGRECGWHPYE